jgi:4'-phosphopantetheinyl transferase
VTDGVDESAVIAARALLSREEQTRCDQFRFACDRRDYALSHALLRTSLSRHSDVEPQRWAFDVSAHGKPRLSTPPGLAEQLTFNLSHARGFVACAVTLGTPVGIDVARTDATFDYSPIASTYFSTDEVAHLASCPQDDRMVRFMELWALKEAYAKATGEGLTEAVSDLSFRVERNGIRFRPPHGIDPRAWHFMLFTPQPHYRIALAVEDPHTPAWMFEQGCRS